MSIAKKVANNTIFQIVGKIVSMSITILATIIVTRTYGKQGYGEFNIMQNIPALFFIISDFGFNAIATKDLSEKWGDAELYFGNILIIRSLMSVILMTTAAFIISFFPYSSELKFGIYLSLFLIFTQAIYATTNIIFQTKLRYDLSTIGYIAGSLLILSLVLILSHLNLNVVFVSFSYVLGGVLTSLLNLYFIFRMEIKLKLNINLKLWKYLFFQAFPLGLMFIFSQVNFKMDSILLSVMKLPSNIHLGNTESVAIYGLPYKIFEVSLVIPTFFMNSIYPVLIRHMHESKEHLKKTFSKSLLVLILFAVLSAVGGNIFAPLVIKILGSSQFSQSVIILRILISGLILFYTTQPLSWLIVTLGNQKFLPLIYFVSALFNVTANVIFIPKYTFYSSAVITLLSEFIILVQLIVLTKISWKKKYA